MKFILYDVIIVVNLLNYRALIICTYSACKCKTGKLNNDPNVIMNKMYGRPNSEAALEYGLLFEKS